MINALRSTWNEPRAPENPGVVWWDRWLVGVMIATALIESLLRDDVKWPIPAFLVAAGLAVVLIWRRTHPLLVTATAFGLVILLNSIMLVTGDETPFGLYTMAFILIIPYALHRWGSGREIVLGLLIILVGYITGIVADYTDIAEAIAALVFALSPALIGAVVRYRSYAASRDRDRAVLQEREQIARELHDTVAHHVSAIAIQAQAGKALASSNPDAPLQVLDVIEAEASRTLAEMRAMVGALRGGEEPDLAPSRGVADIQRLADDVGDSTSVSVEMHGPFDYLPPAVDTAIYRIAQESITNVMRHAQAATSVDVSVTDRGDSVALTVTDDGKTPPVLANTEPGYGLLGMAERTKLLGGEFSAGPSEAGGWQVSAWIPKTGATS